MTLTKRLFLLGNPLTLTETMSDELIEIVLMTLVARLRLCQEEEEFITFYDDPKDLETTSSSSYPSWVTLTTVRHHSWTQSVTPAFAAEVRRRWYYTGNRCFSGHR